ncbi:hypothetical protein Pmani_000203 [Petrolisthes manimaculis]|uniref:Uncharacterized protein n=1 Tax=Petrolisthes manimaculis TaxID=1843537 RepID=A0AAE1QMG5_9EUCA|nr:hypothetical protein Pmani_000203 [Petrolisthes manimaculis]
MGIAAPGTCLAEHFASSAQDLLSVFSWATLDLPVSPQPLLSLEGLNLTTTNMDVMKAAYLKPRRKRTLKMQKKNKPPSIEVELRYLFPLFEVFDGSTVNFEVPFSFKFEFPKEVDKMDKFNFGKRWSQTLGEVTTDFEGMLNMLGLDGGGCVRRALCEMSTMPPLQPDGMVGEMIDIILRYFSDNAGYVDNFFRNPSSKHEGEMTTTQEDDMWKGENEEKELVEDKGEWKKKVESDAKKDEPGKIQDKKNNRRQRMMSYVEAGNYGRQNGDCWTAFPQCPVSLFDLFKSHYDHLDSSHDPTDNGYNILRSL